MLLKKLKNKRVLVLGLGREGIATLKFLQKHLSGASFSVADQKSKAVLNKLLQENKLQVQEIQAGRNYLKNLGAYDVIIKSPGINSRLPEIKRAVKRGVVLSSATNLFFANCPGKVIAVTGSKGKTTTAHLTYEVLRAAKLAVALVGNMGRVALEQLNLNDSSKFYVHETSSYQLEDLQFAPDFAIITSFFPEHLDYHGSVSAYLRAKLRVASLMKKNGLVIYSPAYARLSKSLQKIPCRKLSFNDGKRSKIDAGWLLYQGEKIVPVSEFKLLGGHNYENALAVITLAKHLKIKTSIIRKTLGNFRPLEHRLELVGTFRSITFYNDAISTTPESTIAAIRALDKPISTIVLGGLDRGYRFAKLAKLILQKEIPYLLLFPGSGPRIWQTIRKQAKILKCQLPHKLLVRNMPNCVKAAYKLTKPNTICLLSTASPSYNMFQNFEEKGRLFKEEVRQQAINKL